MSKAHPRSSIFLLAIWIALLSAGARADDESLWTRDGRPTPQAHDLLQVLRHVEDYGLSAEDFAQPVATLEASLDPPDAAHLEQALSLAALRLMRQLHDGRVEPRTAGYELTRRRAPIDYAAMLRTLASSGDVRATLAALEPRSAQYRALAQALARYRRVPDTFVLPPAPRPVRAGDAYAGAPELRRRLEELGDAASPPAAGVAPAGSYDQGLADAVARFQLRHGLIADGVLGARTRAALAVPMSARIRQMELTMERWRWLPDLHPPAVIVNVPQYMLYMLPDPDAQGEDATLRRTPVIVGKLQTQTPVFDSAIEAVVFRPWWNVPRDITRNELLPLIERDPGYLARHDLEIVRGGAASPTVLPADADSLAALRAGRARLRQKPGPRNSLGLIKFVLPNAYAVYLHSTPEAALFASDRRAYSHGCIRVSDAAALAAYLLRGTPGDWNADAIEAATCASETITVQLAKPVPVFILYGTVVADGAQVLFFDDVYGYDRRLAELLRARINAPR